jgi:hypothetical protein
VGFAASGPHYPGHVRTDLFVACPLSEPARPTIEVFTGDVGTQRGTPTGASTMPGQTSPDLHPRHG